MQIAWGWLTFFGLFLDIIGFALIGRELVKPPDKRRFWSGPYRTDPAGFILVVIGFAMQAAGQFLQLV